MRRPRSLYRRQAVYYWRRVIPARFVRGGRAAEIRLSLSTFVYGLAVVRAHRLSAELDHHLQDEMKAELLSPQQWRDLLHRFIADELEEMEALRASEGELTPDDAAGLSRFEMRLAKGTREQLARNNIGAAEPVAVSFQSAYGVEIDPASPQYERLARDILRALIQAHEINAERYLGHYREDAAQPFIPAPAWDNTPAPLTSPAGERDSAPDHVSGQPDPKSPDPAGDRPADAPDEAHDQVFSERFGDIVDTSAVEPDASALTAESTLSEAFTALRNAKCADKKWQTETVRKNRNSLDVIVAILGDRPLNSYTRAQALKARSVMERIPDNRGKSSKERASIEGLIKAADALENAQVDELEKQVAKGTLDRDNIEIETLQARVPRLEPRSIDNHLKNVGQIFKYAREELGLSIENPFFKTGYEKRVIEQSPTRKVRLLGDNDMETLFRSPLYTGCKSTARRWQPGDKLVRDALYWVPLLEAFAGMRLEEACQLTTEDVVVFYGVPWLIIRSTGTGRTKSQAGNRAVPVHRFLIALGFLEHLECMKSKGKHYLFPSLKRGSRGKLGERLSKQYTAYRRRIGLDDPGKDGHALRHAFDTELHNQEVLTVRISELMGHKRAVAGALQLEPPTAIIDVTPSAETGAREDDAA